MSITLNAVSRAPATADAPRKRPDVWITTLILLALAGCMIAASFYVDAPVLDGSLVGP